MLIYKAVQSNIASKDKKKKWHPCLIKMGNVVDTQMIGETIAERSSLTAGDVHNVIRNLMAVMREQLLNSRTVKLEGIVWYGKEVLNYEEIHLEYDFKSRHCGCYCYCRRHWRSEPDDVK